MAYAPHPSARSGGFYFYDIWNECFSSTDKIQKDLSSAFSLIIKKAQMMAAHEGPRTTKLYNRTKDEGTLDEVERIILE